MGIDIRKRRKLVERDAWIEYEVNENAFDMFIDGMFNE